MSARTHAERKARTAAALEAARLPSYNGYQVARVRRDMVRELCGITRARAMTALAAGRTEEGERLRLRALEQGEQLLALRGEVQARWWTHAHQTLAHLLGREVRQARVALERMRQDDAETPPGVYQVLQAECDLVADEQTRARARLASLPHATPPWWVHQARLALLHLRALHDPVATHEQARRLHRVEQPLGEVAIDWRLPIHLQRVLAGGWWPGRPEAGEDR